MVHSRDDEVKVLFREDRGGFIDITFVPISLLVRVLKQVSNRKPVKDGLVLSEIYGIIADERFILYGF